MPRSGTSLVEQIIASHKEVHGMGELNTLSEILAPIISEENSLISDDTINLIRQEYSTKIEAFVQNDS